jgi:hypothetical protein
VTADGRARADPPTRYFLVRVPVGDVGETVMRIMDELRPDDPRMGGVVVTEIVPEVRDGSWMEVAIAAKFARGQLP